MEKRNYRVVEGGWVLGDLREKNAIISASPAEAKHVLISGAIVEHDEEPGRKKVAEVSGEPAQTERVEVVASNSAEANSATSAEDDASSTRRRR